MELERVETGTGWICKSLQGSRGKTGGKHTNRDFRQGTRRYQNTMNIN